MLKQRSRIVEPILALGLYLPAAAAAQSNATPRWIGTWSASPMLAEGGYRVHAFSGVTLREIAHISIAGKELRIRMSNEFGIDPLSISDVHVAISDGGTSIRSGTDHAVPFGGSTTVKIPPRSGAGLRSGSFRCGTAIRSCRQLLPSFTDHARRNVP